MKTFRIAHIFCGIGGKGLGAARAIARHGDVEARFETIGGIDFDANACKDFEMLVGAPTLCADVHELEPADLLRLFGPVAPDAIMMSPPCKGFSGLLSAKRAAEPRYQRMNMLMERALFLVLSTWEVPPKLIFVENVPRIASRGKDTVRRCVAMGHAHGYAIAEGTHDCGELGHLAQHRRRYFQLWRRRAQMPQVVYEPAKQRVRACGEVLGPLPMPGDVEAGGPMHSVPRLSWHNWLRLALIPAGGDWRDLPGVLADGQKRREKFRRDPVTPWDAAADTVTGPGGSASTNVADPRFGHVEKVTEWSEPVGTITRSPAPSSGAAAVADPRMSAAIDAHIAACEVCRNGLPLSCQPRAGAYGVLGFDRPADTVTGSQAVDNGRSSVADPRPRDWFHNVMRVTDWNEPAGTVAGESLPNNGKYSVADPRFADGKKKNWQQVAGVTPWDKPATTVTGSAKIHAGAFQVADPRVSPTHGRYRIMTLAEALALDLPLDRPPPFIPIIIAADGTWHRPLTTLELAVLQSFPAIFGGAPLVLAGTSHTRWREAIGNAVPPDAAEKIGEQLLRSLLLSSLGVFTLSNNEVWVKEALVV